MENIDKIVYEICKQEGLIDKYGNPDTNAFRIGKLAYEKAYKDNWESFTNYVINELDKK